MMETDLTKRIKALTHHYRPKLHTEKRTVRWADEVWTPSGIVDSIRFEDYYENEEYLCRLLDAERFSEKEPYLTEHRHEPGKCFRDGSTEQNAQKCRGCVLRCHNWRVGMMVTCFEVKITYQDFKSRNGHNFHGNENYYCVPKALAARIAGEVPAHIGILAYFEGERQYGLRQLKPAEWQEVSDQTKVLLLYNAMKKWCDGAVFV
jgi:hypothetical protein